ncbi:UvrD-helicase domain-containing protein [Aliiroseovarius sp.]|uniref:ATP-dependent helicase n=1 Tax=Aliiroseovarius sp. TaxID=1872442 RepID=UPI002627CEF2|nr:UvrD-helicase domain-containing protein [Aliiroseovarius sp.]
MSSPDDDDLIDAGDSRVPLSQRAMGMVSARADFPYLDELNPAQREAVEALDGPVLMLAGAGTGKTKALMARIAHLIETKKAWSSQILAVTFTNKAAREMKDRLEKTPYNQKEPIRWMGTFHALSAKLLRRHAELVGLKSNFTILDTDDQIRLLKQLIVAENIDEKRWPPRLLAGIIDTWKNLALTPDKVPASEAAAFNERGIELYAQYQERLKNLNATDFGDLIMHMVSVFQNNEDILRGYQQRFRYILVDEYQDTNVAQYMWLRLLAGGHRNICCVGDDDQSIYGWRGAEVGNILKFEKDFPGAKVVRLEQNYRSTPHILGAASGVIRGNENRLGKELWTDKTDGEKVRLIGHWDGEEEARWVGEEIEALQRGTRGMAPKSLDDMAILVRASHQMRAFEDRFLTIGLPYRVIGGPRFYERMEIRDAMAYFRLAVSQDDDLAFERIVNTPRRGLGDKAVQTIQMTARQNGVSLVEGARICASDGLIKGKGGKSLGQLVAQLDRWAAIVHLHAQPATDDDAVVEDDGTPMLNLGDLPADLPKTHIELAEVILDESGYTAMWQNDKTPEAPGRLENLKELVKALESFENLQGFLEHVSLIMDNDSEEAEEKVTIMTLHAAKGLEYPAVFLPGWEDGLFPSQRSMDETGLKGLEEERRLAYVGITRAEEVCTISFAQNRLVYGQWQSQLPSRFIDELPEEHVVVVPSSSGLYRNMSGGGGGPSQLEERAHRADAYNSPGWKRMSRKGGLRRKSPPNEGRNVVIDLEAVSAFTAGDRVFHTKFGYGTVMEIEGDKLDIEFDKAGAKKVVAKFIVPAAKAGDVPF